MGWLPKEKVVVPIDFSAESLAAVDTALQLVAGASHVHVVHVLPLFLGSEPGVVWDAISDESRIEHARTSIRERLSDPAYADLKIEVFIGDPGHEIAGAAQRWGADLIVMPSHGRTGIRHMLIGSVAERVLRLAHCPVLILRS